LNPTCDHKKFHKQQKEACKLKEITWARIESNLSPIGLNIDRRHVIGGCSKGFPRMEWARLVTNAGSAELDLSLDNEIIFNAFHCIFGKVGAKVTKYKECLPRYLNFIPSEYYCDLLNSDPMYLQDLQRSNISYSYLSSDNNISNEAIILDIKMYCENRRKHVK
jgi:hypothetical protein